MLNAADLAAGIATGIAAEQGNKLIRRVAPEDVPNRDIHQLLGEMCDLLRVIARRSPELLPNENDSVPIFPYPQQWQVPEYDRPHFSIFLGSGVTGAAGNYTQAVTQARLYIEIPGVGTHIKTLNPGWNQLDLPPQTRLASADGNTYNVIVSFRDDAIGVAL